MKSYNIIVFIVLSFVFLSCEENDRLLYDTTKTGVNFDLDDRYQYDPNTSVIYSVQHSYNFAFGNASSKEMVLIARIQGVPVDYDRVLPVKVIDSDTTLNAKQGIDYLLPESAITLPAGKSQVEIPIILNNTVELQDTSKYMHIIVSDNEEFGIGNVEFSKTRLAISSNFKTPPLLWDKYYLWYYFGRSDEVIIKKFVEIGEITSDSWYPEPYSRIQILIDRTKIWFNENPTVGDDGNIIVFN